MMDLLSYEMFGFEVALGAYLLCSFLFIVYFITKKAAVGGMAFTLATFGFIAQTYALGIRWFYGGHPPWINTYEITSFFAWAIVGTYLIVNAKSNYKALGVIVAPLAFILMGFASLQPKNPEPLVPALQSVWLLIHVPITILAYCGFVLSFVASILYLFKEKEMSIIDASSSVSSFHSNAVEKRTTAPTQVKTPQILSRLTLAQLDDLSYKGVAFAFSLLTIGIITGAIWAELAWGSYWSWDPKETWSLITWLVFLIYLHARTSHWDAKISAYIAVFGFLSVLFTFLGVGYVLPLLQNYLALSSGLHAYTGGDYVSGTILFMGISSAVLTLLILSRIRPPGPKMPKPSKHVLNT
jgi:cytochrome c-type biogenesis protein CcsB